MIDARAAVWDSKACVIYHGPGTSLDKSAIWRPAEDLFARPSVAVAPTVLLMDASMLGRVPDLHRFPRHVVVVAADPAMEKALGDRADLSIAGLPRGEARDRLLRAACDLAGSRLAAMNWRYQLICARRDLHELKRIGIALMQEKDQDALLHQILDQGMVMTESDAGSLLLMESNESGVPSFRVALWRVDSLPALPDAASQPNIPFDDTSILGHAVVVKEPMVVDDAYKLPPDIVYERKTQFDQRFGYHIRSMLLVPMVDRREKVQGVLVFLNRKKQRGAVIRSTEDADRHVLPYTRREVRLARTLAGQAAVSIENTRLYAEIEHLLESFVKAAAAAIDQRDPTTAGHSLRVAALTTDLAAAVERGGRGRYRDIRFSRAQMRELRFAALLHDFGKVGVKEDVLLKAKKLPPYLWERVDARFDLIRRTREAEYFRHRAEACADAARRPSSAQRESGAALREQLDEIERMRKLVRSANEPELLPEPPNAELREIAKQTFEQPDGSVAPYLTDEELRFLEIAKGSLDDQERVEIQSHVEQTYAFLREIPWTEDLKSLAIFAYGHHEKLDGSGYPRHVQGADIPIQTRLLTLADIFDALTESDRPYKAACSVEKALDIMQAEAKAGALDPDLVRILMESKVYTRVTEQDWRSF